MLYFKHFTINILMASFIITLFTSYLPNETNLSFESLPNKTLVTGTFNHDLGEIYFTEAIETNKKGIPNASFTLKLKNESTYKMVIVITLENSSKPLQEGTYNITKSNVKRINYSDGVFGYFNNTISNELPFFTDKGKVIITKKSTELTEGYLDLHLINSLNNNISISGKFIAQKN
ncbi:MAG: hypothetical protein NWQ38_13345 [Cellulophaga sp.]|nr:hypothetical protein [Cellulophaga sp.]